MQIAGETCEVCQRKVVFAAEGKGCAQCGTVFHQACEARTVCTRCGRSYEIQERPGVDPVGDAVVPRSLRPSGSGAAVAVMLMAAGVLILGFMFFIMWLMGGH